MHIEDGQADTGEELNLSAEDVGAFDDTGDGAQDGAETVIAFADEAEEGVDDTPLVKRLRDQLRTTQRENSQLRRTPATNDADPEPVIPTLKRSDDPEFDWDPDKHAQYIERRDAAVTAHAEWKTRQSDRDGARKRVQDEQTRQVEQQKTALGVGDYDAKAAIVRERLSDQQLAVLLNGADNPARLIYALGRSETRLDMLAGEGNLAKFAAKVGKMEDLIKVTKRTAPPPESVVRGATASTAVSNVDKHLAALEKEADRSGDRSKVIAYNRERRQKAAA